MTEFYAHPYSLEHTGFYFDSVETYEEGMEKLNHRGCEEVEIQFIDGEDYLCELAKSISIGQGDIHFWFDELEMLEDSDIIRLCFLLDDLGYTIQGALTRYDEVCLYHGTVEDYAQELIKEITDIPETLRFYIDYEGIARDMEINGEITEIEHEMIVTNANDF